jgi:dihydroorotase
MRQLLLDSKKYGFVISTHCQPERKIVARDIALLREVGGNLHIGHISRAETVEMVRRAKAEGLSLTCEVTPHHLFGYDDDYKVNPPLRTKADVEALIDGIRDGTIDCSPPTTRRTRPRTKKRDGRHLQHRIRGQIYLEVFTKTASR